MRSFTMGLMLGGAAAAAGLGYVMKDKNARSAVLSAGRTAAQKAEKFTDDIAEAVNSIK